MTSGSGYLEQLSSCQTPQSLATELKKIIVDNVLEPGSRLPSIRDLSQLTGLSRGQVSQVLTVLRGEGWVEQRQGSGTYVSSDTGRVMRNPPRSTRIGVVLPTWDPTASHYEVGGILKGIFEGSSSGQYRIEIVHGNGDAQGQYDFADYLLTLGLGGLIWVQPSYDLPMSLPRIIMAKMPVVLVGRTFPSLPVPVVAWDASELGRAVADWMVHHRRKHLICMVGPRDDVITANLVDALRAALKGKGIPLPDEQILTVRMGHVEHFYSVDLSRCATSFLEDNRGFDAVYSHYPDCLSQLLRLHESGQWCCPDNYLHIHFCRATLPDTPAWHRMPISIVELPHEIVGREAVRRLEEAWGTVPSGKPERIKPVLFDAY